MNKIGFKNFRRFVDFPDLEYGGVTFLVGKNNSGKSTLVKALMLIYDYISSDNINEFDFAGNDVEKTNIVTFKRAINAFAHKKGNDFIIFHFESDSFSIEIEVSGEANDTIAKVHSLTLKYSVLGDWENKYLIEIKPQISNVTITELSKETKHSTFYSKSHEEIRELRKYIKKNSEKIPKKDFFDAIDRLNSLLVKKEKDEALSQRYKNYTFKLSSDYTDCSTINEIIETFIIDNKNKYFQLKKDNESIEQLEEKEQFTLESFQNFYESISVLEMINREISNEISEINYSYLGVNSVKQSALFLIRDKNNALAQAVHEYVQLGIDKKIGSPADIFVKKWMSKEMFDIGESLKIELHAGEAYEVTIQKNETYISLADNGTGTVQAMLLILRIACTIHKTLSYKMNNEEIKHLGKNIEKPIVEIKKDLSIITSEKELPIIVPEEELPKLKMVGIIDLNRFNFFSTIIIEEPELNLHPAMQSKLADLFHEVYTKYGIQLIVETHSEYLIRKTQLIVKENEYEVKPNENPFTVVYFDSDNNKQWKMVYREDGKFANAFGTGFYDESSLLTLNLL